MSRKYLYALCKHVYSHTQRCLMVMNKSVNWSNDQRIQPLIDREGRVASRSTAHNISLEQNCNNSCPRCKGDIQKKKRLAVLGSGVLLINGKLLIAFSIVLKYVIYNLSFQTIVTECYDLKVCPEQVLKLYFNIIFFVFEVFRKHWSKNILTFMNQKLIMHRLLKTCLTQLFF